MKFNPLRIAVFIVIILIIVSNYIFFPTNIISWDAFGYYIYLPMQFIYNDLGIYNDRIIYEVLDKYNGSPYFYQAFPAQNGGYTIIYTMGLAFHYLPAFFSGHFFAHILNYPTDGFSLPYQYAIFIGGIIYSIVGILFLTKILLHFFNKTISSIVLLLIFFGTNYFVHITMYGQNAYTHNYLFTDYVILIYLTIRWHEKYQWRYSIPMAILSGLMILSRPTEIVCLLIPILWNIKDKASLIEKMKLYQSKINQILIFLIILILIGLPQFFYWKTMTGRFFYNSYGGDAGVGLDLFYPHTIDFLFSFRKGWLIYSPIMIFSIIGFIAIWKKRKELFVPLLGFYVLNIYLISSWSCWWYASSFSQRPMVSSLGISAILLGFFLKWIFEQNLFLRVSTSFVIILLVCLNIFQIYQFKLGVIDQYRMTKKYYFATFGKLKATEEDKKLLLIDRFFSGDEKFDNQSEYSSRILANNNFENLKNKNSNISFSGKYSFKLDSIIPYSEKIELPFEKITQKDHVWFKITAEVFSLDSNIAFSLVTNFIHNGYAYKYKTLDSEKIRLIPGVWNKLCFYYLSPEVRRTTDMFSTYFWLRGKSILYIDDYTVEVFEKKN